MQADESLLTGESEPVDKRAGDRLLSGSFVVAGSGGYQATEVGAAAYARKLAAEARRFTLVRSELVEGINRILRYVTWAIVPVAALMLRAGRSAADDPGVLVVRFRLRVCGAPGMRCSAGKACSAPVVGGFPGVRFETVAG